jgi:signal transduction histidine kinase/putative methionine-R-sulfoxide reductase with GAF domain
MTPRWATESREALEQLADEQAALRRVATLVAKGAAPADVFAAVSVEVDRVFHLDPLTSDVSGVVRFEPGPELAVVGVSKRVEAVPLGSRFPPDELFAPTHVLRTERSARIRGEDVEAAGTEVAAFLRHHGYRSQVASPIVVDGHLWGAVSVNSRDELPSDTEERLERFTGLVATAIANAQSREALELLVDEQAALRRVATLVARDAPSTEVFEAVATEVGKLLDADITVVGRYDGDGAATAIGSWTASGDGVPVGTRSAIGGRNVLTIVAETGKPARMDGYDDASGEAAEIARRFGWRSSIAAPIVVEDRVWGVMLVATERPEPFAVGAEDRLAEFTDLIATAVANADARHALELLAEEQAALRRVAVLVAQQSSPREVFTAVTEAVALLLDADLAVLHVFPGDGTATTVASWGGDGAVLPIGTRFPLDGDNLAARIFESGAPARMYSDEAAWERASTVLAQSLRVRSAVGAPIIVEGKLWGALMAATRSVDSWAENAETRIAAFTELVATAIANAGAREALAELAEEQAALRRVATLVAQGVPPRDLFEAVAEEVGRLLLAANVSMGRYEPDGSVTSMASWSSAGPVFPPGVRWPIKGTNVAWMVLQTGRPARIDDFSAATDPIGIAVREAGYTSAVGSPIVVEGHLWGAISAASTEGPMPPGSEARLASFTELVATAIANAASSAELAASRRRIVSASDDARRRIERDLHDGVQQQLVSLGLELGAIEADPPTGDTLQVELARVKDDVSSVLDSLVEIARGIHPAILSQGGLAAALKALARRSVVPVKLRAQIEDQLPDEVEVAAYYIAAEALTNAAKHARASVVNMEAATDDRNLSLIVRDDGVGGADPGGGSGLVGLQDRVEALGGTIKIDSASGSGTCVVVTLPSVIEPDRVIEDFPPQSQGPRSLTDPA